MKNLKISKKLLISYAVVLLLLVISIAVSLVNLNNIGNQVETFYNGPFVVSSSANVINTNFEAMQKSVFRSISTEDPRIVQDAIQDASTVIQGHMPVIKEHFLGDQALVTSLQSQLENLSVMRQTVLDMASSNQNAEAAAYMEQNNIPAIEKIQEVLDELIQTADNKGEELITSLQAAQTRAVVILVPAS